MDKTVQQIADQETVNMKLRAEIDNYKKIIKRQQSIILELEDQLRQIPST